MSIKEKMKNKDHGNKPLESKKLKQLPFQVEEGYFAALTENIINAAHAEDSDLKYNLHLKKTPFTAPDNYFNQLPDRIEARVLKENKVIPFYQQTWTRWMAVAASIALIATIYFLTPKETGATNWNDISSEAIITFLEEENGFSDELLINIEDIDSILDEIYINETSSFASALDSNPELDYDFEYFDY